MSDWLDPTGAVAVVLTAALALATLPGLTRRPRLSRQLRHTLELVASMKDEPDLHATREVLLRKARRASSRLRPLEEAAVDFPVRLRVGLILTIVGAAVLLTALALPLWTLDGWSLPRPYLATAAGAYVTVVIGYRVRATARHHYRSRLWRARDAAYEANPTLARTAMRLGAAALGPVAIYLAAAAVGWLRPDLRGPATTTFVAAFGAFLALATAAVAYLMVIEGKARRALDEDPTT